MTIVNNNLIIKEVRQAASQLECPFCQFSDEAFLPYGLKLSVFDRLNIVGGGYRENAQCPQCRSLDRERLVFLYLRESTNVFSHTVRVLHFAPELSLAMVFLAAHQVIYETADLTKPYVHHRFDIVDIPLDGNQFDLIICNHVLEHVPDDTAALSELHRILRPGGIAILQVPLCFDLPVTLEDPTVQSAAEREKCYGQEDHVRVYGRDYADRIRNAGFQLSIFDPRDPKHNVSWGKYALLEGEKVFVGSKLD